MDAKHLPRNLAAKQWIKEEFAQTKDEETQ